MELSGDVEDSTMTSGAHEVIEKAKRICKDLIIRYKPEVNRANAPRNIARRWFEGTIIPLLENMDMQSWRKTTDPSFLFFIEDSYLQEGVISAFINDVNTNPQLGIDSNLSTEINTHFLNDDENGMRRCLAEIFSILNMSWKFPDELGVIIDVQAGLSEYINKNPTLDFVSIFLTHINYCFRIYCDGLAKETYYSPYFTIVQSSGYGKTRLILETAKLSGREIAVFAGKLYVIYICLRKPSESGWPSKSKIIADYILQHIECEQSFWEKLIQSTLYCLNEWDQTHSGGFDAVRLMLDHSYQQEFWSAVLRNIKSNHSMVHNQPDGKVLFVIDEASNLLDNRTVGKETTRDLGVDSTTTTKDWSFFQFRRALKGKGRGESIMGVLLDTNSTICNFMPLSHFDKSARVANGQKLLPPFYTFPPLLDDQQIPVSSARHGVNEIVLMLHFDLNGQHIAFGFNPAKQYFLSRPMFFSQGLKLLDHIDSPLEFFNRLVEINDLALYKLLLSGSKGSQGLSASGMHALLCCRYYLESTASWAKDDLIDRHMGTCVNISEDRSKVSVQYPSEPALINAALSWMNQNPKKRFGDMIQFLQDAIFNEQVTQSNGGIGEAGELISQIVICKALDDARKCMYNALTGFALSIAPDSHSTNALSRATELLKIHLHWTPVPLILMLQQLHPAEAWADGTLASKVETLFPGAIVFCTHFIKLDNYSLKTLDDLQPFLESGAGIVFMNGGETGTDWGFPILYESTRGIPVNLNDKETFQITLYCEQVKNQKNKFNSVSIVDAALKNPLLDHVVHQSLPFILTVHNVTDAGSSDLPGIVSCDIRFIGDKEPDVSAFNVDNITIRHGNPSFIQVELSTVQQTEQQGSKKSVKALKSSTKANSETETAKRQKIACTSSVGLLFQMVGLNDNTANCFTIPCLSMADSKILQSLRRHEAEWYPLRQQLVTNGQTEANSVQLVQEISKFKAHLK